MLDNKVKSVKALNFRINCENMPFFVFLILSPAKISIK